MRFDAASGLWRVNYRSNQGEELEDLLHAYVWPRTYQTPAAPGQWLAVCNPAAHKGQVTRLLSAIAARLGLMPVHFATDYQRMLDNEAPVCIVADTNAIYNGALYQALRIRKGKPTSVIVPDQVFMEMQRRRGLERPRKTATTATDLRDRLVQVARWHMPLMGSRLLDRIRRELRYIIYQARPPEAMVRYFGSDAGDRTQDEIPSTLPLDAVGPNFHRDRLILEVARHVPSLLPPGVPVWLATGDADLAAQAHAEGFHVGFSWLPDPDSTFTLTSPHIDPRSGRGHYVSWTLLLEELLWNTGGITLQQAASREKTEYRLPEVRERVLLEHDTRPESWLVARVRGDVWSPRTVAPAAYEESLVTGADVPRAAPRKAPAAQSLVKFLCQAAHSDGVEIQSVYEPVRPYLSALGWAEVRGEAYVATARGAELAARWSTLTRNTVEEHAQWLKDASVDLLQLQPVSSVRDRFAGRQNALASLVADEIGWSERDVHSQARLLCSFSQLVRISGRHWGAVHATRSEIANIVLGELRRFRSGDGGRDLVGTDNLFRHLLDTKPLSLVDFRLALVDLLKEGRITSGGSVPVVGKGSVVSVDLLVPASSGEPEVEAINLSAGDFLLPGESSQTLRLIEVL